MFDVHSGVLPKKLLAAIRDDGPHTHISHMLVEAATMEIPSVLARFSTRLEGLTTDEARARLAQYGPNVLAKDQRTSLGRLLWHAVSTRW